MNFKKIPSIKAQKNIFIRVDIIMRFSFVSVTYFKTKYKKNKPKKEY